MNIFNDDFRDFIHSLNSNRVEYIVVGGYAVILNGYRRSTGDIDIWVNRTIENYKQLMNAFYEFGLPTFDLTEQRFMSNEADVFTYGRPPVCIEILTKLKGVSFEDAFIKMQSYLEDGIVINFLHLNNLIEAKKAAGRYRDLDDIDKLTHKKKE